MSTATRPRASFGTAKKNVSGVRARAQTMHSAMTAAASTFVAPTITMSTFLALITALTVAQESVTGTKAKGSGTLRNTRRDAVWTAMETLRAYVQAMSDALPAAGAASIIELAGLRVAATARHTKEILTATLTTTPGTVHLDANRSLLVGPDGTWKRVTFNWEVSANDGETWTALPATPYATTDVEGLGLIRTYVFRVRVTVGRNAGAWSQAVGLLVH